MIIQFWKKFQKALLNQFYEIQSKCAHIKNFDCFVGLKDLPGTFFQDWIIITRSWNETFSLVSLCGVFPVNTEIQRSKCMIQWIKWSKYVIINEIMTGKKKVFLLAVMHLNLFVSSFSFFFLQFFLHEVRFLSPSVAETKKTETFFSENP